MNICYWKSFVFSISGKMSALNATFSVIDYVVLIGTLLISAAIGVYFRFSGGRQATTKVC